MPKRGESGTCRVCGATPLAGAGMCRRHYARLRRGDPLILECRRAGCTDDSVGRHGCCQAHVPGPVCAADACSRDTFKAGLCTTHYWREYERGDANLPLAATDPRAMDAPTRFWAKVEKTDGCWLWTGAVSRSYGLFTVKKGVTQVYVHRYAYELLIGPIPDGIEIDHECHNAAVRRGECKPGPCAHRLCVNPAHLAPKTRAENAAERRWAVTHCPHDHEYTPENTRVLPSGSRVCKTCERRRAARSNAKRKEARRVAREGR